MRRALVTFSRRYYTFTLQRALLLRVPSSNTTRARATRVSLYLPPPAAFLSLADVPTYRGGQPSWFERFATRVKTSARDCHHAACSLIALACTGAATRVL